SGRPDDGPSHTCGKLPARRRLAERAPPPDQPPHDGAIDPAHAHRAPRIYFRSRSPSRDMMLSTSTARDRPPPPPRTAPPPARQSTLRPAQTYQCPSGWQPLTVVPDDLLGRPIVQHRQGGTPLPNRRQLLTQRHDPGPPCLTGQPFT